MKIKKFLALLIAAALAVSLLAGCGGGKNQSLSQVLLNLLDGQYQNVSVEIDPDLEADLRQAIRESETEEELRAALTRLLGGGISFQLLGSGQKGDSAWNLILYPGTDPNAAARSVYLELDKVFARLPADGQYTAGLTMVETENGYAILVRATVEKAGREDKPDPVTLKSIAVTTPPTKTTYWVDETFDPKGMVITAAYSDSSTKTIENITSENSQGVSWTPNGALDISDTSITITYGGQTATVSVTVNVPTVESITVEHTSLTYTAGATFKPADLGTVTATYTNNKTEDILPTDCTFSIDGQEINSSTPFTTAGDYTLTVSYSNMTATAEITVNPATVTGIEVTSKPTKMTYISGESFDPAGMTITATYSNGTKTAVTDYTYSTAPLTKDNNVVTISYGGQSTTVEVTILDGNNSYDAKTKTYSIATADGLMAWNEAAQKDLSINCALTADINMAGKEWTWIGIWPGYSGVFNGQGHRITGLSLSAGSTELFCTLDEDGVIKNLQLVDVNLHGNSGGAAGIVSQNNGQIIACSVTGTISAYSTTCGIANSNYGSIIACWFDGTLKENECGAIVNYNCSTITSCYWGGNAGQGVYYNKGGTVDVTKVDGANVTWQTAVDGMNAALTGNNYKWTLGTDGLPTLKK